MRISAITVCRNTSLPGNMNKTAGLKTQNDNVTFGMKGTIRPSRYNGFFWDSWKLKILDRNEEEMKELGRAFYEFSLKELKEVAKSEGGIFHLKERERAYAKLIHACFNAREEKTKMENMLAELKQKPNPTQAELATIVELKKQIENFDINPNNYLDYVEAKFDPYPSIP